MNISFDELRADLNSTKINKSRFLFIILLKAMYTKQENGNIGKFI